MKFVWTVDVLDGEVVGGEVRSEREILEREEARRDEAYFVGEILDGIIVPEGVGQRVEPRW
jgi:hypothetical protein